MWLCGALAQLNFVPFPIKALEMSFMGNMARWKSVVLGNLRTRNDWELAG